MLRRRLEVLVKKRAQRWLLVASLAQHLVLDVITNLATPSSVLNGDSVDSGSHEPRL